MSWEWSHTDEAIDNAQHFFLCNTDKEWQDEIAVEWMVYYLNNKQDSTGTQWEFHILKILQMIEPKDQEWIWEEAEANRVCDNGGFNLWMCPYGCEKHYLNLDEAERFQSKGRE